MKDLTNEQLCGLAQAGDGQAISRLIEANLPFVRKVANQIVENPVQQEHLSACGVGFDDLVQAGSIGLWRAIDSYDFSRNTQFLTYAAPAVRRAMSDLIRQYSLDTVWRLRHDKANAWKIIYLDEDLDGTEDDTVETLIASPCAKLPEQIYIEQETAAELHEAMDALPDRECVYVQYRFGFADGKDHPLPHPHFQHALIDHLNKFRIDAVRKTGVIFKKQIGRAHV